VTTRKTPWAHTFGNGFDGSSLAGRIATIEDDHDPLAWRLYPVLQMAKLRLQLAQLLFLSFRLNFPATFSAMAHLPSA
jgi:hypothetical protein